MNYDELVTLAESVGLNEDRARVAAAIALAESGGNPNQITNDSDDLSYGLWQINMIGDLGPKRRHDYGLPNNETLLDPRRNAMVMAHISNNGGNFNAWTTYTSGEYKKFLKDKSLIDRLGTLGAGIYQGTQNAANNINDIGSAVGTLASAVTKTATWVSNPKNWVRIAYVTGGSIVVLVALGAILRTTPAGQKAITATKKVATKAATRGMASSKGVA